jgi:hypothetical protein
MKFKNLLILSALIPTAAFANPPFKYKTPCILESQGIVTEDVCTVVETREDNGALKTRNIFSNKFRLSIKSRFDKIKGFVTWDNFNNYEYKWDYKVKVITGKQDTYSEVMPGVYIESISWN